MTNEMILDGTKEFLENAFCIDGEAKLVGVSLVKCSKGLSGGLSGFTKHEAATYKLNDSKRGVFFVSLGRVL